MTIDELQECVGERCKHKTLGARGEIVDVCEIYGELIVEIMWDNGAMTRYTPEQCTEYVELASLRKTSQSM